MKLIKAGIVAFKSILDETIYCDPKITVLIGGNDSGKSNILQAITRIAAKPERELTCHFSPQYGQGETFTIESEFAVREDERESAPIYDRIPEPQRNFRTVTFRLKESGDYFVRFGSQEISGSAIGDAWARWLPQPISVSTVNVSLLEGTINVTEFNRDRTRYPVFDRLLHMAGITDSAPFARGDRLRINRLLQNANRVLSPRLKNIWGQDAKIELNLQKDGDDIDVIFREGIDTMVPITSRGDGFQRLISLWIYVESIKRDTRAGNAILLLDEPDNYLHERGQRDLMKMVEEWSQHYQIVYATHSPFVIDANHLERVRLVEKTDKGTVIRRRYHFTDPEPLRSTIGSFITIPLLVGERNIFVEGPSDQILLAGMSLILTEQGMASIDLNLTKFIPSGGDERTIIRSAAAKADGRAYAIAMDGDARNKKAIRDAEQIYKIKTKKIVFFGKDDESIEDVFPFNDYLEAVNSYYIGLGIDYEPLDVSAIKNREELSHHFEQKELEFDKVGVAQQLVLLLGEKIREDPGLYQDLLSFFEQKFRELNEALERPL